MTFVDVTHDQEEALTMSDRVAVFDQGRIEQVGTPAEVYDRPTTEFVAGFVGTSNILGHGGRRICVRPERIAFAAEVEQATVIDVVFVGAFTRYLVETDGGDRLAVVQQADRPVVARGERVRIAWSEDDAFELPEGQPLPSERREQ